MKNKWISFIYILILSFSVVIGADKKSEGATEKDISRIMKMVFYFHYNKSELNEDIMKKTMHNFLARELDYQQMYLLQADYDKWMSQTELIGKAYGAVIGTGAEWRFLYDIQKDFDERYKYVTELTLKSLESMTSIDQTLVFNEDAEKRGFPKTVEESAEWLKFYLNYNLAYMMQKKKYSFEEAKNKLKDERKRNDEKRLKRTNFDTVRSFINAFNNVVDPHTTYYSPRDYQDFNEDMKLSFDGIGARLLRDEISGVTMIIDIMPNGPAFKSGLLKKYDEILGVKEENEIKFKDVVGLELNEVVRSIKGPSNTRVIVKVRRTEDNNVSIIDIPITRGKVESKDEEASITYERVYCESNKESYLIGVIYLPSFYRDFDGLSKGDKNAKSSASDVEALLIEAQKNKVDGVIFNLQSDSGGSLTDAIRIVGLFINSGPVVITKNNKGLETVRMDTEEKVTYEGPLLVTINKRSASASEIVAGALKDYQRALIVGESSTFGKGTVQEIYPLGQTQTRGDIGAIKITINQFFTAGGDSTQWNGVASDISYPSYLDGSDVGEKEYPSALKFEKIKSYVDFDKAKSKWLPISSEIKQLLKEQSQLRIKNHPEFIKIQNETKKALSKKDEQKILKVSSYYQNEDSDEENLKLDFSLKMLENVSRADLNQMVKHIDSMNIFPKKNFGIDESPAPFIAECLKELVGKENLNDVMPRDVKHASSIKARSLVKEIEMLQKKVDKTNEDQNNLIELRKKLIVEYYPDFRGPYQNSLFIKESLNVMADLITLQKSMATVYSK